MLLGSTAAHFAQKRDEASRCGDEEMMSGQEDDEVGENDVEECLGDVGPESGPQSLSSITLAVSPGTYTLYFQAYHVLIYFLRKTVSKGPLQVVPVCQRA
jgi:hypothetical protein